MRCHLVDTSDLDVPITSLFFSDGLDYIRYILYDFVFHFSVSLSSVSFLFAGGFLL